jgi:hypothetical protein
MVSSLECAILLNTYAPFSPSRFHVTSARSSTVTSRTVSLDFRGEMIGHKVETIVAVM